MARSRLLKPGFFKNEDLAALPFEARLLYAGLWTIADKEGRLEDRPTRIRIEIFPYEALDVEKLLSELQTAGFIVRYAVDGRRYLAVPTFLDHQRPHVKEAASVIPPPSTNLGRVEHQPRTVHGESQHAPRSPVSISDPVSIGDPVPAPVSISIPKTGTVSVQRKNEELLRVANIMIDQDINLNASEDELVDTFRAFARTITFKISPADVMRTLKQAVTERRIGR